MAKKEGTYKEKNGTTRIGDFLRTAAEAGKEFAPGILELAGDLTGVEALNKLAKKIEGSEMPQQDKDVAIAMINKDIEDARQETERIRIMSDLEGKIESEISNRWEADSKSESWMARNTRPLIALSVVFIYLLCFILDCIEGIAFSIPPAHETIIMTLLFTAVGGYFAVRSTDKYFKNKISK